MNCPECGAKCLIGSNVCPICDMLTDEEKQNQIIKILQRKKRIKFLFFSIICLVVISLIMICLVYISKGKIHGINNGNAKNENLLVSNINSYYYSTIDTLYSNNKKFNSPEVIDSTTREITDLCFTGGSLYYIKDNKLCKYNPKTRKIKTLTKTDSVFSIAGYSEREIYYNIGSSLYKFVLKTETLTKIVDGYGLFSNNNDLFILYNNSLYEYNIKDKSRKQICNVEKYTIPAYIFDGNIVCYDYKNCNMISVNIETSAIKESLKTEDFENISDIAHLNIYKSYIFLRGENGLYRYNRSNADYVMLSSLGYIKYVLTTDDILYTVAHDNSAYFSDFDGKIKYSIESNK